MNTAGITDRSPLWGALIFCGSEHSVIPLLIEGGGDLDNKSHRIPVPLASTGRNGLDSPHLTPRGDGRPVPGSLPAVEDLLACPHPPKLCLHSPVSLSLPYSTLPGRAGLICYPSLEC